MRLRDESARLGQKVEHLHRPALERRAARGRRAVGGFAALKECSELGSTVSAGGQIEVAVLVKHDEGKVRLAQARRVSDNRLENRTGIRRRVGDGPQNLAGDALLLESVPQFLVAGIRFHSFGEIARTRTSIEGRTALRARAAGRSV